LSKNGQRDIIKPKPVLLPTLTELLLMGSKDEVIHVSSSELAKRIGKSQQAVSNHLQELEEDGYIERIMGEEGMV